MSLKHDKIIIDEVKVLRDNLESLVRQLRSGNQEAFNSIYENTYRQIYFIVLPILKDKSLTEDILQDTYLKFLEKLDDYKSKNLLAYLIMIAKNLAINEYNRRKRDFSVDRFEDNFEFKYDEFLEIKAEKRELIEKALSVLDQTEKNIFLLHSLENLAHREIAQIVDKPLGTVTWLYQKAVRKMRKFLKDDEDEI